MVGLKIVKNKSQEKWAIDSEIPHLTLQMIMQCDRSTIVRDRHVINRFSIGSFDHQEKFSRLLISIRRMQLSFFREKSQPRNDFICN